MTDSSKLSGERRVVTALFCDMVGSTSMAEDMDPEDWSEVVNRAVGVMSSAVESYGGTVTQFSGDSVLAIFGAPVANEDDPHRAVRAGLEILTSILAQGVRARIGINTGLMVISDLQAGAFSGVAALGDAANAAARIQGLAPAGSILVGASTAKLISSDFDLRDMGEMEVKGKSKAVHVYEVTGARGTYTRGRGLTGLHSALVGRDEELAILRRLVDAVAAGRGRFAAVIGEAGIGKSRLLRELADVVRDIPGACYNVGSCLSYGGNHPYHLVASLVRSLARVPEGEDDSVAGQMVAEMASELFGAEHEAIAILQQLVGARAGAADMEAQYRHVQYVEIVSDLIARHCASQAPQVLVFEDIHWADESSVELLESVLPRCADLPVLVVLLTRPDRESGGWKLVTSQREQRGEAFTELRLKALDEDQTRSLVANLLDVESLTESLRQQVLAKTDGNPFFVEEVVRMLIDRDMVERREGRWYAKEAAKSLEVPNTVRGLLTARIDLLPVDVRRAGMVAAVIGRRFEARLFAKVHTNGHAPSAPVHPHLGRLEEQGFIQISGVRPTLEFSFRHALVHDVMYSTLLNRERRALHQKVGEALEEIEAHRIDELSPVLAEHFDRADDGQRAQKYLMRAAQQAMKRHAVREAHAFFERALARMSEAGDELARTRVEATLGMSMAGMSFVPVDRQIETLERVRADVQLLADANLQARLNLRLLRILLERDRNAGTPEYQALVNETIDLMKEVTDPITLALVKGLLAQVRRFSNEPWTCLPLFEEAADGLEANGWLSQASFQCGCAGEVCAMLGEFAEADRWLERASTDANESGDPNARLDVNLFRGRVAQERGQSRAALELLSGGIEAAAEYGNTMCELVGNHYVAEQHILSGQAGDALPYLQRSNDLAAYCNAGSLELLGRAAMNVAETALGRSPAADFAMLLGEARASGSLLAEGMVLVKKGAAAVASSPPNYDDALGAYENAIENFTTIRYRPAIARTRQALAAALERAGQPERAAEQRRLADEGFRELGIVAG